MSGTASRRGAHTPKRNFPLWHGIRRQGRLMGLPRRARAHRGPSRLYPLSRLCGGLASYGGPTVTVRLRFRVGLRAARNPLVMDILLGDRIALPVHLLVDRGFTVREICQAEPAGWPACPVSGLAQAHTPGATRLGTGEIDSPAEESGFEPVVPATWPTRLRPFLSPGSHSHSCLRDQLVHREGPTVRTRFPPPASVRTSVPFDWLDLLVIWVRGGPPPSYMRISLPFDDGALGRLLVSRIVTGNDRT